MPFTPLVSLRPRATANLNVCAHESLEVDVNHVGVAEHALSVAVREDGLLWSTEHGSQHHRLARDRAVSRARVAGMSLPALARGLGVKVSDIERMLAANTNDA